MRSIMVCGFQDVADTKGQTIGLTIEPLYPKQIEAISGNDSFYELLSLVDVIRVGKVREVKYAINQLRKNILHESSH